MSSSSAQRNAGNRGSRVAAPIAVDVTAFTSGSTANGCPTQPRSLPADFSVVNTPRGSARCALHASISGCSPRTPLSIARRAVPSRYCRSSSENSGSRRTKALAGADAAPWEAAGTALVAGEIMGRDPVVLARCEPGEFFCGWGLELRSGNVALLPAAQDERPATAPLDTAINLRPECREVVARGPQRKRYHRPHRRLGDELHGKDEPAPLPHCPARVQDCSRHRDNLQHHLEFAQITGFDREALLRGNGAQAADQEFSPDDHHRHPRRYDAWIKLHQGDKCRRHHQLVG